MSTKTQFNPNLDLNRQLINMGLSKTVYALVTPEIENTKCQTLGLGDDWHRVHDEYFDMFREAWTGKQDAYHQIFFDEWCKWSSPVIDFDRALFPYYYPTAGASEPIRQLIYQLKANKPNATIHAFEGEYEGYRAMAEAAGLGFCEHPRDGKDGWSTPFGGRLNRIDSRMKSGDLFFISQPSAIDGNVWREFNEFVGKMQPNSVVADVTYVGAVPEKSILEKFNLSAPAVRNVVFSLSKPFGVYYDRIGGVFSREEDLGLFGNRWFKNLTSIRLGTALLRKFSVFDIPKTYAQHQKHMVNAGSETLGALLEPSDVFILATGRIDPDRESNKNAIEYLTRAGKLRVCLTPGMATLIGESR